METIMEAATKKQKETKGITIVMRTKVETITVPKTSIIHETIPVLNNERTKGHFPDQGLNRTRTHNPKMTNNAKLSSIFRHYSCC